jgi:hypothetical protein
VHFSRCDLGFRETALVYGRGKEVERLRRLRRLRRSRRLRRLGGRELRRLRKR